MGDLVTVSSKGQIVIPKNIREIVGIDTGSNFAIFAKKDTIVLRRIDVPHAEEVFEGLHRWGTDLAKEKGWKEEEMVRKMRRSR